MATPDGRPAQAEGGAGPLTRGAVLRLLVVALVAGLLWGVLEGALYPAEGGPRLPLSTYWTLLVTGVVATLLGMLVAVERVPMRKLLAVMACVPLALVAQDWSSLLVQGTTPQEATWYEAVFGEGPHTRHDPWLGLPGAYWFLALLSLACLALLRVGGRGARAGPRRRLKVQSP